MVSISKHYTENVPGIRALEGELSLVFPSGATIRLYGGALAYEGGCAALLSTARCSTNTRCSTRAPGPRWCDRVWRTIAASPSFLAPAMATITSAAGELKALDDPAWDVFDIKVTDTGSDALAPHRGRGDAQRHVGGRVRPRDAEQLRSAGRRGVLHRGPRRAAATEPGHPRPTRSQRYKYASTGIWACAICRWCGCSRSPGANCIGSTISRAAARRWLTIPTCSGSRRRPAASATRRTCCHDVESSRAGYGPQPAFTNLSGLLAEPVITVPGAGDRGVG